MKAHLIHNDDLRPPWRPHGILWIGDSAPAPPVARLRLAYEDGQVFALVLPRGWSEAKGWDLAVRRVKVSLVTGEKILPIAVDICQDSVWNQDGNKERVV